MAKDYQQLQQLVTPGDVIPSEQAWSDGSFIRDTTLGEGIKARWVQRPISEFTLDEVEHFPGIRPWFEGIARIHFVLLGNRYVADLPVTLHDNQWSPSMPPRGDPFFIGFEELNAGCVALEPPGESDTTVQIIDVDTASIKSRMFEDAEIAKQWQPKVLFFAAESIWGGWATQLMVEPKVDPNPKLGPLALASAPAHISYLIRNGHKQLHALRLVLLLDFHPVSLLDVQGIQRDHYDWPELAPQDDVALTFILPALSPGLHQLSFLQIADPESTSDDWRYRLNQQNSFWEERFDLWVNSPSRPRNIPAFEDATVGRAAKQRTGTVEFVLSQTDPRPIPLTDLAMRPGEEKCLNLRIFHGPIDPALPAFRDTVPLRIAVFWNDRMGGVYDYAVQPNAPVDLALRLLVKAPSEPGAYQLGVAAFQFPGYSQYSPTGEERTGFYVTRFSRRILVTIGP